MIFLQIVTHTLQKVFFKHILVQIAGYPGKWLLSILIYMKNSGLSYRYR